MWKVQLTNLGIELNAAEERITAYVNKEEGVAYALDVTVKGIITVASFQGTANDAKNANAARRCISKQPMQQLSVKQANSISLLCVYLQKKYVHRRRGYSNEDCNY